MVNALACSSSLSVVKGTLVSGLAAAAATDRSFIIGIILLSPRNTSRPGEWRGTNVVVKTEIPTQCPEERLAQLLSSPFFGCPQRTSSRWD